MCWEITLKPLLTTPQRRVAIVGIGHELRGDDAVGIDIVRRLQAAALNNPCVLWVEAGYAPENVMGCVHRFRPDIVLFIDAVSMHVKPGTIRLVDLENISGEASSTHALSIKLVADYLRGILNCRIILLGIQPSHCEFGARMSSPVKRSLEYVVDYLSSQLQRAGRGTLQLTPSVP